MTAPKSSRRSDDAGPTTAREELEMAVEAIDRAVESVEEKLRGTTAAGQT
jgi:hypothetical protein